MSFGNKVENNTVLVGKPIDDDDLRNSQRRSVLWYAILHVGDHKFNCQIRNFSMGGLKLKLNLPLKEGTVVKVEIPMRDIILNAEISWQADNLLGIHFLEDNELIQGVFGERASGRSNGDTILQRNYRIKAV